MCLYVPTQETQTSQQGLLAHTRPVLYEAYLRSRLLRLLLCRLLFSTLFSRLRLRLRELLCRSLRSRERSRSRERERPMLLNVQD